MSKAMKTLRALGRAAPIALTIAMMASSAHALEEESYWYASGDPTVPDGPNNLPPCVVEVPAEVTVKINFEFDKYMVPENVVNREVVAEIDDYIQKVQATPEQEFVTVVGHTDAKGSDEYNMALGERRADAVRNYIIAQGYPADQVGPAESRGKRELLPDYDPFSVEQRRVVLTKTDM